jgi:hypothetical protein
MNELKLPDLSRLSDDQLENLEDFCTRKCRDELWEEVMAEMLRRPNFVPSSYGLGLELAAYR